MAKADAAEIRVDGLRQLRRDLKELGGTVDKGLTRQLRYEVGKVATEAGNLAPFDSGQLAASYRPFVTQRTAGVRSRLPYAPVIEYGGTIRPRGVDITFARSEPVTRAVLRTADEIVDGFTAAIERAARSAGWH
jgi:hypothetical protein